MNKMSMSMLMGMETDNTKGKVRQLTIKRVKDVRQARRLSRIENVVYNLLWARQNAVDSRNGQGIRKEAKTLNFSDGGIGLLTAEALKPLEIVHLSFSHSGMTIPTIAEVVWAGQKSVNGLYRIGLRYLL